MKEHFLMTRVSFDVAKRLKEVGYPQCTKEKHYAGPKYTVDGEYTTAPYAEHYAAPLYAEVFDWMEDSLKFDDIELNLYLVIGSYNFTNISGLLHKVVFKEIIAADSMSANSLLDEICKKFHDDLSSKNGFMTINTIIKL